MAAQQCKPGPGRVPRRLLGVDVAEVNLGLFIMRLPPGSLNQKGLVQPVSIHSEWSVLCI
jgi:hypothetical protein